MNALLAFGTRINNSLMGPENYREGDHILPMYEGGTTLKVNATLIRQDCTRMMHSQMFAYAETHLTAAKKYSPCPCSRGSMIWSCHCKGLGTMRIGCHVHALCEGAGMSMRASFANFLTSIGYTH